MLEALVFIIVFVILGQMWHRLQALELRLEAAEFRAEPVADLPPEPFESWTPAPPAISDAWPDAENDRDLEPGPPEIWFRPEPVDAPTVMWSPLPEPDAASAVPQEGDRFGFEELFGRRLSIWAGGVTLAVAGFLLARYSIETGLLSPLVRMVAGFAFGAALIAAAELASRFEAKVRDVRVRQALSGAGIATLYAAILVGTNLYALIDPMIAFIAMAGVTALAMALSLRFGAPSALLGLVGGFAAPALVGAGEPNLPLLTIYLALAVGGLSILSRVQRWIWLGISALVGGLGWGVALLLGGILDTADSFSVGLYLLVVGIAIPFIALPSQTARLMRVGGSIAAAAQMAALVATGGFSLLHWGLFGLISMAVIWLSRREPALSRLAVVGLALVLLLVGGWPDPAPGEFALVLLVATALYGGAAVQALWRPGGSLVEVGQVAALAVGGTLLAALHFYRADHSVDLELAAVALGAALLPVAAAGLGWKAPERMTDSRFALLVAAAALLVALAMAFALPLGTLAPMFGALAVALLLFSFLAEDERIEAAAWLGAVAGLAMIAATSTFETELGRLAGLSGSASAGAMLRWAALAGVASLFAWRARWEDGRGAAQAVAASLFYGAASQFATGEQLALLAPVALLVTALIGRHRRTSEWLPTLAVLLIASLGWTLPPLLQWSLPALASLAGDPLLVNELPPVRDALLRLLIPSLLIGAAAKAARRDAAEQASIAAGVFSCAIAAVTAHILFKQVLGLASDADFIAWGVAERMIWTGLLVAAGLAARRLAVRPVALAFGAIAIFHLGWYSLLLHNPLWTAQAVGGFPVMNLLAAVYGLPLALIALARRLEPDISAPHERPRAVLQILLVVALAFSSLRQMFHGSILVVPGLSPGEDIGRSILAIALAVGFLLWGIRQRSREWRVASLLLMLCAAAKVFLLDAAGLEGLMRIASFVALGFSLIGIGWLYSRPFGGDGPFEQPAKNMSHPDPAN